jgi:SNF2 family DNA or RNA helicase
MQSAWYAHTTESGLIIGRTSVANSWKLSSPLLPSWLAQLEDEGLALSAEGKFEVPWNTFYKLRAHPEHAEAVEMLELPPICPATVSLVSRGSLSDSQFSIALADWRVGGRPVSEVSLMGAVLAFPGGPGLLPFEVWTLVTEVKSFARRPDSERTDQSHRLAWGRIRQLAVAAGSKLDSFLRRTVVLTPEKLEIRMRRSSTPDDTVIELQPTFDGAPADWIERFDRSRSVQSRYDIPTEDGIVQIVPSPEVYGVLAEIKRMPNRRVAGARAQAFILNPYATLGDSATTVIDEEQFERARQTAGICYERFVPKFDRDAFGYPHRVGLIVEAASSEGPSSSEEIWLEDNALSDFVKELKAALTNGFQILGWEGYDLELQGDASSYLAQFQQALEDRRRPPVLITHARVYDLSHYGARVEEIGFEKPYYSPYIARKRDDEGWLPENIINVISWTPDGESELSSIPLTDALEQELRRKLAEAEMKGLTEIEVSGFPKPIPIGEAKRILETFEVINEAAGAGTLDPESPPGQTRDSSKKRKSPVLLSNIQNIDYAELRSAALSSVGRLPKLPDALRPEYPLLPHQREGVAWLQTLYEAPSDFNCRGAVLADDMGLGKTLQLLTLITSAIEGDPNLPPVLVVAPVALLENWKEEVEKFLKPGSVSILTAYGDNLSTLRVARESIEARLLSDDGLVRFLRPGWVGDARIVLTTYETLRDLEFSFAAERWSIMVCDEAQKIKNPAAMVTRAAKKQNVKFRIACTGTPVENSLADLWCLFDFVQPGLLGALNEFGHRYRKPIEARTDEEKERVEQLRKLIAPQLLRRTKSEVAQNLPRKIVVESCRSLPLSLRQRDLYAKSVELFKRRNENPENAPFKNFLGLLHYWRLICTDPRRHGLDVFRPDPLSEYRVRAPKLDWLLRELEVIRQAEEKAIIFCEFRNIQRLLQYYISETFDFRPDIINGDTNASASHAQSRQKRLRHFQSSPGFGVIVLSPLAVGFGVNIQKANRVIHYTRTWNPAKEDQATDRAYRIGQTRDVFVYYPVVVADDFETFDVKLDRLLEDKRLLAQDMLNGSGDLRPGDFDIADGAPPGAPLEDEAVTLDSALSMSWDYFEALTAVLFAKRGFETLRTAARDNGVDVIALSASAGSGKLIQTKASTIDGMEHDWDAVKEVVAGRAFYARQFPKIDFGLVCMTNQFFNRQAQMNAALNGVELIEQDSLTRMLAETPVTMQEVERVLFKEFSSA